MYLPVASSDSGTDDKPSFSSGRFIPRRYCKLAIYALFVGGILGGLMLWVRAPEWLAVVVGSYSKSSPSDVGSGSEHPPEQKWEIPENPPPDYADYRLNETKHPQHNPNLPFPEGRTGKYVYFSGHITGASSIRGLHYGGFSDSTVEAGWGNALQEHFFQGLLAYVSGRSCVATHCFSAPCRNGLYTIGLPTMNTPGMPTGRRTLNIRRTGYPRGSRCRFLSRVRKSQPRS